MSGKFAGYTLDLDVDAWRTAFEAAVDGSSERGHVVSAWLAAFSPLGGTDREEHRAVVGHCPVLALGWELVLAVVPDPRMLHVVRSPFASFAGTKRHRPDECGGLRRSMVARERGRGSPRGTPPGQHPRRTLRGPLQAPRESMTEVATWLGLEFDDALLTKMWNGKPLADKKPFGGNSVFAAEYEQENIAGLGPHEREILRVDSAAAQHALHDRRPHRRHRDRARELHRLRRQSVLCEHHDQERPDAARVRDRR